MSTESNVRVGTLRDPVALRAFAHPIRMRLHELVGRAGSLTAADAARELGISHALASHHLRQLAKYGFVEPADASDERARPWRVTATSWRLERDEPEVQAAADVLDRWSVEQAAAQLAAWQDDHGDADPRFAALAGVFGGLLYLRPDELDQVLAAWRAILQPLADARPIGHLDARPADAIPIGFTLVAVPVPRTERER